MEERIAGMRFVLTLNDVGCGLLVDETAGGGGGGLILYFCCRDAHHRPDCHVICIVYPYLPCTVTE